MKQSLQPSSGSLRVFVACLLSFTILITPIAAVAAPGSGSSPTVREGAATKANKARSTAEELFVNPPSTAPALPGPQPEPAPEPLPPPPAAVTATMTAALTPTVNNGNGQADPGDTINYTVQLSNTSGSDATGLSFNPTLDSHTTFVGGSIQSTPVAFDHVTVNTNEDTAVVITLQGQDPDGTNITFTNLSVPAHGTLGSIGSVTCAAGVCSEDVTYTPAADYNGPDSFTFKVNDGTSFSNEPASVPITVIAVNDAPTFTVPAGNPPAVNEDAGAQSVSFITPASVRPAQVGNTTEDGQTVSFVIDTNSNPGLFSSGPALNVVGASYPKTATLTYTSATNQNGTATITYHAHDNGGTANSGVDNSSPIQTFTITVNAVNDPPVVVAPAAYSAYANMKVTGLTGLLGNVNDNADNGVNGCSSTTFTVTSGSISATSPAGGVVSNVNLSAGTFDFDPPPGITGDVTFTYTVSDTGCPGVAISAPVTVHVTVSGTVIWFVNPAAGVNGTGTLNSPFNLLASANTAMGLNAGQRIFVYSGTTTSGVGVALTTSQWLIGQGATDSGNTSNFDTLMGLSSVPANTIARPAVNGTKPTIQGRVQMNASNTRVQGVAIAPPAGTQGLTATSGAAMTGMQVGVSATQSDVTVTATGTNGTNALGVSLNNAGGVFSFISINVNKDASNNQPNKGILLSNTTGSFNVLGTGSAGTGGTIQNVTSRGLEAITATNLTLKYMNFTNANTANGANPNVTPSTCGDIGSPTDDNTGCNAAVYLQSVTGTTFDTLNVDTAAQMGINGNAVVGFSLANSTVKNAGNEVKESGIYMKNLTGTVSLTNSVLGVNHGWQYRVHNFAGALNFTATGTTFNGCGFNNVNCVDGFLYSAGTGSATINISGSNFRNNHSYGSQIDTTGAAVTTTFDNNDFGTTNGAAVSNGNSGGIALTMSNAGTLDYTINNNRFYANDVLGIVLTESGSSTAASRISGTISNNIIGDNAVANSGAASNGFGIQVNGQGAGSIKSNITNNTISQVTNTGINIETMTGASKGVFHIKHNTINAPAALPGNFAISVWAGNTSTDSSNVCLEIGGATAADAANKNTINGVWSSNVGIRMRQRFGVAPGSTVYTINGLTFGGAGNPTSGTDFTGIQNWVAARNTLNSAQTVSASSTAATGFQTGTCATVTPLLLAEGGVLAALNSPSMLSSFALSTLNDLTVPATSSRCYVSAANLSIPTEPSVFATSLDQQRLDSIVAAAIDRWTSTGLTSQQLAALHAVKFDVADLSDAYLGEADGNHILVDIDAQGNGWYIDSTPQDDSEFGEGSGTRRYTDPMSAPAGHVDLLTAIMHEMGHKLGLGDSYQEQDRDNLMYGYLTVGERRIPSKGQAVNAIPSQYVAAHFLSLLPSETPVSTARVSVTSAVEGERATVVETRVAIKMASIFGDATAAVNGVKASSEPDRGSSPRVSKGVQRSEVRNQKSEVSNRKDVRLNHARSALKANSSAITTSFAPMPVSGGTFPINGTGSGFILPNNKTITITFSVTLNNPPNLSGVPPATPQVSSQGTLSGAFAGNPLLTDDTNVPPNTGEHDPTVTLVDRFDTTTLLGAVPAAGSWNVGQTVTFTATVASNPPGNPTTVTGTVTFKDGVNPIAGCSNVALSSAQAQCVTTFGSGSHSVTAVYSGDGNFDPSTSSALSQGAVNASGTSTAVTSSLNPSLVTQNVTFTATVTSTSGFAGPPTGTVTFKDGVNPITCNPAGQTLSSGVATCQIATLAAGSHSITAVYNGDTNFTTSTGTLNTDPQVVNKSNTTTVLTSSLNPVAPTVQVTYTATVASSTSVTGPPTGIVTFNDGVNPIVCELGSQALTGGVATCKFTYPDTTGSPHDITAVYDGDATFNGNTSNHVSEVVQACSASVVVTNTNDAGAGSLRDAIDPGVCAGGTITFNIPTSDPNYNAGTGVFTIKLTSGELLINKDLIISGPNAAKITVTRDTGAATNFRIFHVTAGTVSIANLTVTGGTVASGGLFVEGATTIVTVTGTLFTGNTVTGSGGGAGVIGGGTLNLINTTVSGNTATNGGGLYNSLGTLNLTSVTVTNNNANGDVGTGPCPAAGSVAGEGAIDTSTSPTLLKNSIVAGNTACNTAKPDISGAVDSSSSYNIIGVCDTGICGLTDAANHNQVGSSGTPLNALLGPLADNGGPTQTHALLNLSPALEKGNAFSLTTDQRGFPRPVDFDSIAPISPYDDTDIGAYERSSPAATITKAFGPTSIPSGGSSTVTLTLTNPNAFPLTNGSFSDTLVNMSVAATGPVGGTCVGTTPGTLNANDTALSFSGITIPASTSCTVIFAVTSSTTGTNPNATSGVSTAEAPTGVASNTANLTVFSGTGISKAFNPIAIQSGGTSTVTLTLSNTNATPLTNAFFTDTLVNMSAVGGAVGGSCVGTTPNTLGAGATALSFSGITIPGSGSCTVTFDVTSGTPGTNPNSTSGVTTDQTPIGAGSGAVNLTVFAPPTIAKAFNPTAIQTGGSSTVTLTLANTNASDLTNASFTDTLVNMSVAATGPVGGTCVGTTPGTLNANDTVLSFSGITIPASGNCTVTFAVKSSTLGPNPNSTSGVTTTQTTIAGTGSNSPSLTVLAPPTVLSITRADANPTSLDPVHFTVTFSRSVTGVDTTDFTTTTTGGIVLPLNPVTNVTPAGPSATYTVTVATGTGDGTLRLNVADDDTILSDDAAVIPLGGSGAGNGSFITGDVYTVDRLNPFVSSITRTNSSPTNTATVDFTVTFSEAVTGVDITDFALITSGLGGVPAVTNVAPSSGPSVTYTVTASTGTGDGTIKLRLFPDNDSIIDVASRPLAPSPGTASGDGSFTPTDGVAAYTIDRTTPGVTIKQKTTAPAQADPVTGPTASTVINFTAVFSEPIVAGSFTNSDVNITGTALATVANVSEVAPNDGTTYNVAVEGMTQSGTVIVDIPANRASDLAGNLNTASTTGGTPSTDNIVQFFADNFTTFEVNSLADPGDGVCDPVGTGDGCTLREAINAANADAGLETITFAPALTSGGPATISLLTALPDITSDMTIQGPGANLLTVERNSGAASNFRIFNITSGTVTVSGLTITKGLLGSSGQGGGISNTGTLILNNDAVTGNQVGSTGFGGGILNTGTLTLNGSTVSGNSVATTGGGGGGIYNPGTMTISNSTISGNQTGTSSQGAGILSANLALTITSSTITGNTTGSSSSGGGIFRVSGTVTLKNTIVGGGNTAATGPDIAGAVNSEGFNLIQSTSGATITETLNAGTNITGQDPLLIALADNGGPTKTHALQCTSPAIDKGFSFTLTTDQRGLSRPFDLADSVYPNAVGGDGSDIGAYETQTGGGCIPTAVAPSPPSTNEDTQVTITLRGTYSHNTPLSFTITQQPAHSTAALTPSVPSCAFDIPTSTNTCTATVSYTPSLNFNGLDTFKFKVSAGAIDSEEADVNITVNAVNDAPSFLNSGTQTVNEDAGPQSVPNFANTISPGAADEAGQTVQFIVTNNTNPGLFSAVPAIDPTGTLTYTPAANANGSATITIVLKDNGGTANGGVDTSAPQTFTINVLSVNDAPSFIKGSDQTVIQNSGAQTVNPWATGISRGPANESGQTLTFQVTGNTNAALFSAGPAISSTGVLTYTPAANASGTAAITVVLKDDGGTANGGVDTSAPQTFNINVNSGGTLQLSAATYSVLENAGPATITITRTGGSSGTATVQIATSNGTATAGSDYTAVSQTVTFNDGDTSKTVNVPITDDVLNEPDETVNLTLSNATGSASLGTPVAAVLTILNDDPIGGYIKFSSATYDTTEGSGSTTITVQRLGTLTQAVTVDYATSDDSDPAQMGSCAPTPGNTIASSRCDFNTAIGKLGWAAGDGAPKTFTVLINQDSYLEGPESLPLTLSNLTGGATFATPSTATLTIADDDLVAPTSNVIDDPASFVRAHYHDFLNREPDAAGLAFWTNEITSCGANTQCIEVKRINVSAAFFLAIEFQVTGGTAYLTNKVALGGLPSYMRFETDAQALGRNYVFGQPGAEAVLEANKVAFFNEYISRTEFMNTYNGVSDQTYVNTLINNTGVAFTQAERDALLNGLTNHTETRATVLRKISEKTSFAQNEFTTMFVLMEYFGYLRRNPDTPGFNFWLNKLNSFNGNFIQAEMVKAFIISGEYRQRFGP